MRERRDAWRTGRPTHRFGRSLCRELANSGRLSRDSTLGWRSVSSTDGADADRAGLTGPRGCHPTRRSIAPCRSVSCSNPSRGPCSPG